MPHSVDESCREWLVNLSPKSTDMSFYYARLGVEVEIPYLLKEHCPGDNPTLVTHQILKQGELTRQEIDRKVGAPAGAAGRGGCRA